MKVERIEPVKVGFKGTAMVKALSRGRPFNPETIDHALITVSGASPGDFKRIHEVRELILRALVCEPWIRDIEGGALRQRSAVYQRDGKWQAVFELG